MAHQGGCFCGTVRYRAEGEPSHVVHCHCTICRRASGAPFVTWATFPAAAFAWTKGAPRVLVSSPPAKRRFCADCGTALTFQHADLGHEIDVTVASFDRPETVEPGGHIWTRSRLPWIALDDGLPQHAEETPEDTPED